MRSVLTRRYIKRCFGAMVAWLIALIVALIVGRAVCMQTWWYGNEPLYPTLSFINRHPFISLGLAFVAGALVIFAHYWRQTLACIDEVVEATEQLVARDGRAIELPPHLREVTDRLNDAKRRALEAERAAALEAQQKNDLLVYLAHDLKTPLTSVIGYLQLLYDEQDISPDLRRRYEGVALNRAERLEDLINEFFEVARLNLSKSSLMGAPVNLSRMVEQVMFEYLPIMEPKGLTYGVECEPNLTVVCDINKIERVFDNLVRNAVNYSYPNSQIQVVLGAQAQSVDGSQPQPGVEMRVINHGDTIAPEQLERLFDQFYRLSSSRDAGVGGSGLGLAIAKGIVEAHEGTIRAESADGLITFILWLPMAPLDQGDAS